ncbi:hypothetical protein AB0K51_04240 [Kitasatospora sp. NPDC049285]|uniref:hypothetical protein n=1 Tax=Kitasatospora sp. NPDC049285 TaxID=3157096 RepID=UPI0034382440
MTALRRSAFGRRVALAALTLSLATFGTGVQPSYAAQARAGLPQEGTSWLPDQILQPLAHIPLIDLITGPGLSDTPTKTFYVVNDTYKYTAKVATWTNPDNIDPLWVPPSTAVGTTLAMGAFHTWNLNFDFGAAESVVTYELDDASGHFVNILDIDMKTSAVNRGSASCATSADVKCNVSWTENNSVIIDLRTNTIPPA